MKYIGDLITEVRRDTRNEDVPTAGSEVGIATDDILRYANYAQEKCQATAISAKSTKFRTTKEITLVAGNGEISINDRVYLEEHILNVRFFPSSSDRDWYDLTEIPLSQRNDNPGNPCNYIRKGRNLILCPAYNSSGAKVKATYDRAVDSLDIRRGQITDYLAAAGFLVGLTLDVDSDDAEALARAQYLCINDAFGNVTMYNIPIVGYNETTGVVAVKDTSFQYQTGETVAVGSYVTVGEYTTTHGKLNHLCERYMAQYMEYKMFRRDSSNDANAARDDMRETMKEIKENYAETPRDDADITVSNSELMVGVW